MNLSQIMDRIRGMVGGAPTGSTTARHPGEKAAQEPAIDEQQTPAPGPGQQTPPQGS